MKKILIVILCMIVFMPINAHTKKVVQKSVPVKNKVGITPIIAEIKEDLSKLKIQNLLLKSAKLKKN